MHPFEQLATQHKGNDGYKQTEQDRGEKGIRQDFSEQCRVLAAEGLGDKDISGHGQADEKCGHQHDDRQAGGDCRHRCVAQEPADPDHVDDTVNGQQQIA